MNISFLAYNIFGIGGTVKTIVNTANHLADKGFKVEIISIKRTSDAPSFPIDKRIKVRTISDSRAKYKYHGLTTINTLLKKGFSTLPSILIHKDEDLYKNFSLYTDYRLIKRLKKINSGALVTTIPSFNLIATKYVSSRVLKIGQEHKEYNIHSERLQKKIKKGYGQLDILTCLTDNATDYYSEVFKNNKTRIVNISNATKLGVSPAPLEAKQVIAIGRFVEDKGFDNLILAFEKVVQKYPDWKLKIFGDGELKNNIRESIHQKGLFNNILIYPSTKNVSLELRRSSIFALSSNSESFGMVIIEAMAEGVPCVAFACDGPKKIINHGQDGILIPCGDVDAFSKNIMQLIEDRELRHKLGINAFQSAKNYSLDTIGKKWESILLKNNKKPNNNKE
ncbi:MAG: glycosyltransferase family 4 protein [Leclercia adecarboxylata]|uniref:glycosyltransferase family 4 protein n=1 Tax=Empedobacter sp. UBA5987 TaxID=1946444 RepID=UPI0025C0322C|nr:glycosyltransferase family 4 protein [Empedobacter sp. UBA5987]MDU1088394.1 glycosyltransferase family 4 protein [Leclercia adecarboxylata]